MKEHQDKTMGREAARGLAALALCFGAGVGCGPPGLTGGEAGTDDAPAWGASASDEDAAARGGEANQQGTGDASSTSGVNADGAGPEDAGGTGDWSTDAAMGLPDPVPTPPVRDDPVFTWCEFIATAADDNRLPSLFEAEDSRGGSVEINFNGWWDTGGDAADAPFEASILTLRNGASTLLEQWHVNRTSPPGLHADGCNPARSWPECFVDAPEGIVAGVLATAVPTMATSSNDDFDPSGLRVEVSGEALLDYTAPTPWSDNSHETMQLTWDAPLGLDTAQVLLRGRYDRGLDGLDGTDVMIDIVRINLPLTDDLIPDFVTVLEASDTRITIEVPVHAALKWVQAAYAP